MPVCAQERCVGALMSARLPGATGDPTWLGAFALASECRCEAACGSEAEMRCAWLWRARIAVLHLCRGCAAIAQDAHTGSGRRLTASEGPQSSEAPVRIEISPKDLRFDWICGSHRTHR